jgi:alpha-tubulin suppressor-like RCC1 family protein
MANVILGKVAITWKGAYNSATTYYKQDVVSNGADTFICTATSTTGTFASADWDTFAQGTVDITTTAGDMIYNDGTNLVRLPIGTSGQVLGISSSTLLPEWQSIPSRSSQHVAYLMDNTQGKSCGNHNVAVIMSDGTIRIWGYGGVYSFGNGANTSNCAVPQRPAFPKGFPGVKQNKFYMQHDYSFCCIDNNDDFWVWGRQGNGVTGTGTNNYIPVNVSAFNNANNDIYGNNVGITAIAHGSGTEDEACQHVIGSDGKVYAAGYNGEGQLGDASFTNSNYYKQIQYFSNYVDNNSVTITKVSMGRQQYTSGMALDSAGGVHMWGHNAQYQLGDGTNVDKSTPFLNTNGSLSGKTITNIYTAPYSHYLVDSSGHLHFCGGDYYGSSGLGVNTSGTVNVQSTPVITFNTAQVTQLCHTFYDYSNCYILDNNNDIWATGYNGYGQLGVGDNTNRGTWTKLQDQSGFPTLASGETITKISHGGQGSYGSFGFLTSAGRVFTCGYNGYGQLGHGDTSSTTYYSPTEVPFNHTITDFNWYGADGSMKLVVLTDDGRVFNCGFANNLDLASEDAEEYYTLQPVRF